jgi:hypothetical protein
VRLPTAERFDLFFDLQFLSLEFRYMERVGRRAPGFEFNFQIQIPVPGIEFANPRFESHATPPLVTPLLWRQMTPACNHIVLQALKQVAMLSHAREGGIGCA